MPKSKFNLREILNLSGKSHGSLEVTALAGSETEAVEIWFYGSIIDGFWFEDPTKPMEGFITPESFRAALDEAGGRPILLRIHSPGGYVEEASAMRAMLMSYPGEVTCRIDGLCASAATFVATAGTKILMQDTAFLMVHEPSMIVMGNVDDFKQAIKELNEISKGIAESYQNKTGLDIDQIRKMMADETWMSAETALQNGFVDEVIKEPVSKKSKNLARKNAHEIENSLKGFAHVPAAVKSQYLNVTEEPGSSDQAETSEAEATLAKEKHAKAIQALREKIQVQKEGERYDISL
jgi:ATP-dependent Clp protease protease subunit